jgi:hypothetical protein
MRIRSVGLRRLGLGLTAALGLMMAGDRWALTAPPRGIDPLQIMDNEVKPNVIFVLDTSSAMGRTVDTNHWVGGDDPASRFYQAKQVLRQVVADHASQAHIGLVYFAPDNTGKVLTEAANGGPLVYVSRDANVFGAGVLTTLFNGASPQAFANYNDDLGGEIRASFSASENGFGAAYPTSCTPGTDCRYYIKSRLFRNGRIYRFRPDGTPGVPFSANMAGACPVPPAGLTPDLDANGQPDPRACFQVEELRTNGNANNPPRIATFFFTSGGFGADAANAGTCSANVGVPVPPCATGTDAAGLLALLNPELPVDATGVPTGLPPAAPQTPALLPPGLVGLNPPSLTAGLRLGNGNVPLGEALKAASAHYASAVFPSRPALAAGKQRNYVVLITGSDNNCGATVATAEATDMFANHGVDNKMETLVVGYGVNAAATANLNAVAQAGSGNARNAFFAGNPGALRNAISAALAETVADAGDVFSDQQSITESIFELVGVAVPSPSPSVAPNPLVPETRYSVSVPVLLQSTFQMPNFKGHLKAFRAADLDADGQQDDSLEVWDAATQLNARVAALGSNLTFAQLLPSAAFNAANFDGASGGIKRRILTTQRNGVFATNVANPVSNLIAATGPGSASGTAPDGLVPLWPPTATVNPAAGTVGPLDRGLGIDSTSLTFDQLRSELGACANWPGAVTTGCGSATLATRDGAARKEAREMILAFTAGAQVMKDAVGQPLRQAASPYGLLYQARPHVLGESTLSAPAVVAPPLDSQPSVYKKEYENFFDTIESGTGRAQNGIDKGFGLRHPDKDGAGDLIAENDLDLKPVMTVVYHGANDMLHAFRAAPCPAGASSRCGTEAGGDELWAFVPFDQLRKLKERINPQGRDPHTYMVATPIRFADVFVPGTFSTAVGTETVGGAGEKGVWRTVIFFGRGIGGRSLTALDVTVPGAFTRKALNTNLPIVYWSRGNPDTQDGTPTGVVNNDVDDKNAYAKMGQTWSVPSVALVDKLKNLTARKVGGTDFVLFVGSGYREGSDPEEGRTFFVLDALTGDLARGITQTSPVKAFPIPNGSSAFIVENALVGSPASFNATQLSDIKVFNPAGGLASSVYFGDLHSRVWKYDVASGAPPTIFADLSTDGEQPVATGLALINVDTSGSGGCSAPGKRPHIFIEAGNDNRVPAPSGSPSFRLYGYCDTGAAAGEQLFAQDFGGGFRGTSQPATAFANLVEGDPASGLIGLVFFAGTKVETTDCVPQFSSILFALAASSGGGVYDLDGTGGVDSSISVTGQRINAVRVAGGKLVVDTGLQAQVPPPPPAASKANPGPASQNEVFTRNVRTHSLVCRE